MEDYQGTASTSMKLYYPRDIFGDRTGIWDDHSSVGWVGWDVYWSEVAGQRLNMGGSSAYIDHSDAVGSTTMETDPAGGVQWDMTYYPWGQIWQQGGTRQTGVYAGLDWQVNDPIIPSATREYNNILYRWNTPDALGGDVANPQSLNRYAYVLNNPTTFTDPLGLQLRDTYNSLCTNPMGGELRLMCSELPFGPGSEFDLNNIRVVGPDSVLVDGGCLGCGMGSSLIGLLDIGIGNPGLWGQVLDTSMNLGPPPTDGCTERILNAGNNRFGTDSTANSVIGQPFPYSKYGPQATWTVNLNISAGGEIGMVSTGRFPVYAWSYIFGIGPTLHVPKGPSGLDSSLTIPFGQNNDYTEHLDNSYFAWWNPITWATHGAIDVLGIGRNPCP